jgi:hypothetical protein
VSRDTESFLHAVLLLVVLAVGVGTTLTLLRWGSAKAHLGGVAQALGG